MAFGGVCLKEKQELLRFELVVGREFTILVLFF